MFKKIKKYFNLIRMGRYSEFLMTFIPWDNFLLNFYRLKKAENKYQKAINIPPVLIQGDNINDYELSVFSQNGEDGILDYIFEKIGTKNKKFVEIGFGHTENNSLYMISRRNFSGLLIDGGKWNVTAFNNFNKKKLKTENIALEAWIDKKNINNIISSHIPDQEIEYLSIDIDGNDYWFWDSITCVNPRVVIMEYNASFGLDSITVPYNDSFDVTDFAHEPKFSCWYHGASLSALSKLGEKKGYILLGTEKKGVNCFFLRKDIADSLGIEHQNPKSVFTEHFKRTKGVETKTPLSTEEQFEQIKHFDFINI
jgi:hypothetical protein